MAFLRCVWSTVLILLGLSYSIEALVSERTTLLEFKTNIIDKSGKLSDWGSGDPCGDSRGFGMWKGVTCTNASDQRTVDKLNLNTFFLEGVISESLVKLANLSELDLGNNMLSGPIPGDLSKLENLRVLNLGNNALTGTLPRLLPRRLSSLDVQHNFLSGGFGETNLYDLDVVTLKLQGNSFGGNLDLQLGFSDLTYLDVSRNQLEGLIPNRLLDLPFLDYCNLSRNNFTGEIPQDNWINWLFPRTLDFSRNKLSGSLPSNLMSGSQLDSSLNEIDRLHQTSHTTYFNVSGNSLSGIINLTSTNHLIKFLDLSNNQFEGSIPDAIGDLMSGTLEFLHLQNNRLSGNVDSILKGNFSRLRELRLGGNDLSVGDSLSLSRANGTFNFPRLQLMDLSGCGLEGQIPPEIFRPANLPSLRSLDLSTNRLHGKVPTELTQMTNLEALRLQNNALIGEIDVSEGSDWKSLGVLDLSNNQLSFSSTQVQVMLTTYSKLRELRLGSNDHQRKSLPKMGLLENLEILDLRNSSLIGNLSQEYSLLPSLKYLDLSNNLLEGPVSEGFASNPNLVHLDLSYNHLSGSLPVLPLILRNETFFTGNKGLCGVPLQSCSKGSALTTLEILAIVFSIIVVGCSCLLFGWAMRRRVDAVRHKQDVELIAMLLDKDTTHLMSLRELQKATNDFSKDYEIGAGGFGTVYGGRLENGTTVAIKKSNGDGSALKDKVIFLNEVRILSQVHHRNLVRLLGCCLAKKNALLVFEFVPNGTLEEHLRKNRGDAPLTWDQRLQIALQTASALDYLHHSANPPIYHLDVKSANILLDEVMHAKVADFGISKLAPAVDATHITTMQGFRGTFGYMDPESVESSQLTGKSDVYAFGVVLLELITAKAVVDVKRGENISLVQWARSLMLSDQLGTIVDPTISDTFWSPNGNKSIMAVARLAERCLTFHSKVRPYMKEVSNELLTIQSGRDPLTTKTSSEESHGNIQEAFNGVELSRNSISRSFSQLSHRSPTSRRLEV